MSQLAERSAFEISQPGQFAGTYLAEVVSVDDPDNIARVQVRLLAFDHVDDQDGPIWARVAVPFAGDGWGAFLLPTVGDEVVVTFVNGDSRMPIVVGALWNGGASPPERLGGDGSRVDRWTLVGKRGTRIAIVEEQDGQAKIRLSTPGEVSAELTETAGGKVEFKAAGATVTVDTSGLSIQTPGQVQVQGSQVQVTAGQVSVSAAMSTFSGVVTCDTLIATTVVGTTYTPGVGNVW